MPLTVSVITPVLDGVEGRICSTIFDLSTGMLSQNLLVYRIIEPV
jgi:hypothetical protein